MKFSFQCYHFMKLLLPFIINNMELFQWFSFPSSTSNTSLKLPLFLMFGMLSSPFLSASQLFLIFFCWILLVHFIKVDISSAIYLHSIFLPTLCVLCGMFFIEMQHFYSHFCRNGFFSLCRNGLHH